MDPMAGFVKRSSSPRTTVPSGIPTLDRIVQLAPGSISCIFEDEDSFVHNTLLQVFASSMLHAGRKIYALSSEKKNLVSFRRLEESSGDREDDLVIAWRYKSMARNEPEFQLNLMEKEGLGEDAHVGSVKELLGLMATTTNGNFVVFSLFSPLLPGVPSSACKKYTRDLVLFEMRKHCKLNSHCMLLSVPKFFVEEEISQYFDNILAIRSMLTLQHEKSSYHCLVEMQKLASIGCLRINKLESYKYGLVLRPRKLAIERIDVPPEEAEASGQPF